MKITGEWQTKERKTYFFNEIYLPDPSKDTRQWSQKKVANSGRL